MERTLPELKSWDKGYLMKNGRRIELRGSTR